jgi:hypothetical protein
MDTDIYQRRRPLVVTLGLAVFVANQVPNLVADALHGNWHSPYFYIIFVLLLAVVFVPVWFVLRGNNLARWLLVAIFFAGFGAHLLSFINSRSSHSVSAVTLDFVKSLVDFVALSALFLPSSNRWFLGARSVGHA